MPGEYLPHPDGGEMQWSNAPFADIQRTLDQGRDADAERMLRDAERRAEMEEHRTRDYWRNDLMPALGNVLPHEMMDPLAAATQRGAYPDAVELLHDPHAMAHDFARAQHGIALYGNPDPWMDPALLQTMQMGTAPITYIPSSPNFSAATVDDSSLYIRSRTSDKKKETSPTVRIAGKEVLEEFLKRLKELLEELKKATGATTAPSATLASSVAPAPSSTPEQPKTPEPAPAPAPAAPEKPKPPSLEESLKKDISFADFKKGVEIGGKIVKIIPESAEILVGDTRWHFRLVQPNMPGITASFSIGSIAWDSATGELAIQAKGSAKLLGVLLGQKDVNSKKTTKETIDMFKSLTTVNAPAITVFKDKVDKRDVQVDIERK
jgi:hypothetical protein